MWLALFRTMKKIYISVDKNLLYGIYIGVEVGVIKMLGDMYYTHIYIHRESCRHVSREVLIEKVTFNKDQKGRININEIDIVTKR